MAWTVGVACLCPPSQRLKLQILFAHGAGLPSTHSWMEQWAERLGAIAPVTRFDYAYMAAGRRRPDHHTRLLETHRSALQQLEGPVLLVGKSMGGRIGCHLALEEQVVGAVCLGFPLVSASGKRRDQVLFDQRSPVFFVQGTRDKMCPLELLDSVRERMQVHNGLHVVPTGDHSLRCTRTHLKQTQTTQEQADQAAVNAIAVWISDVVG